jgi:hypothetical protein
MHGNMLDTGIFCTGISLLTEYFILKAELVFAEKSLSKVQKGTGISLRTECVVLECPYGLTILYWNIPAE